MGVKRDNVPFAGVNEGTESPNKVAKAAKLRFTAGLDLLTLKKRKPPAVSLHLFPLFIIISYLFILH